MAIEFKTGKQGQKLFDLTRVEKEDEAEVLAYLRSVAEREGTNLAVLLATAYNRLYSTNRRITPIRTVRAEIAKVIDVELLAQKTGQPVELIRKALGVG